MTVNPLILLVVDRIVAAVKVAIHPVILYRAIGQRPGLDHLIGIGPACVILPGEVEMPVAIGISINSSLNFRNIKELFS